VGGLFVRNGVKLATQQRGGPQERERRGGTENTAGIIGMGVAADLAAAFVADERHRAELTAMRDGFEAAILAALSDTVINARGAARLWNTSNLGFPRLEAEAILLGLSERGVCASAGAACSSGSLEPSPVLLAMGVPEPVAHGSVRFSLSRFTTQAELDRAVEAVTAVVGRLRQTLPV
jgi:cysteine desulfurase